MPDREDKYTLFIIHQIHEKNNSKNEKDGHNPVFSAINAL